MNQYVDPYGRTFQLDRSFKISITQSFDESQPNHFGAEPASIQPIEIDGFVGDINQGGSCNCDVVSMTPHCNGTHTETVGHIVETEVPVSSLQILPLLPALLITVSPSTPDESSESYRPPLEKADQFISAASLRQKLVDLPVDEFDALIVRTLPNELEKMSARYGSETMPPFFSVEAMEYIFECGFDHLLVDLPSVDKMHDDGKLTCHHLFWNVIEGTQRESDSTRKDKTITEMVFVHEAISDGIYLLNLQIADWKTDAAPSRPVIFPMS